MFGKKSPAVSSLCPTSPSPPSHEYNKLVVFDKDGTLLAFDKPWLAWCSRLMTELGNAAASNIKKDLGCVLGEMGVNLKQGKIELGAFAEACFADVLADIKTTYTASLEKMMKDNVLFSETIESCREEGDASKYPLTNISKLFSQLRELGYAIAVATADTADGIEKFFKNNQVEVDFVLCADTPDYPPKPSKISAEKLCSHFGVHPDDVVMVGDTPTDMRFGINGNFGLVVGVTTGIGEETDLKQAGAHIVLDDLTDFVSILKRSHCSVSR